MATHTRKPKAALVSNNSDASGPLVADLNKGTGQLTTVVLGNVAVTVPTPSDSDIRKQIAAGKRVAREFAKAIQHTGVNLKLPPTVPQYVADPQDPNFVIRKLGKTRTRGNFDKSGQFVEVKK